MSPSGSWSHFIPGLSKSSIDSRSNYLLMHVQATASFYGNSINLSSREGGREAEAEDGRRGEGDSGTNNCNVDWMSGCAATTAGGGGVLRDLTTGLLTLLLLLPMFWVRRWWRLRCPRASRHLDRTFRHGFGYLPRNNRSSGLKW